MTIQEALQNIDIVVSNARMNRQEHAALQESIAIVAQRCQLVDELEKNIKELELKVDSVTKSELEKKEDGRTNEQTNISGANQEDSK